MPRRNDKIVAQLLYIESNILKKKRKATIVISLLFLKISIIIKRSQKKPFGVVIYSRNLQYRKGFKTFCRFLMEKVEIDK